MAHSMELEARIDRCIARWKNTGKKKMFGGVCYLLDGNMVCGVHRDSLILRLGDSNYATALQTRHVKVFDMTGRPMRGWVVVEPQGMADDEALKEWLNQAKAFVQTLPPK